MTSIRTATSIDITTQIRVKQANKTFFEKIPEGTWKEDFLGEEQPILGNIHHLRDFYYFFACEKGVLYPPPPIGKMLKLMCIFTGNTAPTVNKYGVAVKYKYN